MEGWRSSVRGSARMLDTGKALAIVEAFAAQQDGLAIKSRELIVALLSHTEAPFSREQYLPGHITCSAIILDTTGDRVLLMHHHRHQRWLLPGGHVEATDRSLAETARREAMEETGVAVPAAATAFLVGMDVHAIPPGKGEPYHLHHDLVFALRALDNVFTCTEEAPRIAWVPSAELGAYQAPLNIVRSAWRAQAQLGLDGRDRAKQFP